jgi:hypothetical protein
MTDLDLTELPGDIADAMVSHLPAPDVNRTEWTYGGDHTYVAKATHQMPDGHIVTVHTGGHLSELIGEDWRHVVGLTADEWDDFLAQWKESA